MIDPKEDLIVMYHYVWPDGKKVPGGVRPMLASKFEEQLDGLMERYEIVSRAQFLKHRTSPSPVVLNGRGQGEGPPEHANSIDARSPQQALTPALSHEYTGEGEKSVGEGGRPKCLLTFDDATRDHFEVVLPILLRRKLSGVFFAIQNPSEGIMPLTHAAHWLLSDDDARVWNCFVDEIGIEKLGDEDEARRIYHYEPPIRARIKFAINFALDEEPVRRILSMLAREKGIEIDRLARDWFASPEQLKLMRDCGMTIGVHARTHRSLKAIGGEAMAREIESCAKWLTNLLGEAPKWFACPFGGVGASEIDVELMQRAIRENGFEAAVGTVSSSVPKNADRFALPRVDCVLL